MLHLNEVKNNKMDRIFVDVVDNDFSLKNMELLLKKLNNKRGIMEVRVLKNVFGKGLEEFEQSIVDNFGDKFSVKFFEDIPIPNQQEVYFNNFDEFNIDEEEFKEKAVFSVIKILPKKINDMYFNIIKEDDWVLVQNVVDKKFRKELKDKNVHLLEVFPINSNFDSINKKYDDYLKQIEDNYLKQLKKL